MNKFKSKFEQTVFETAQKNGFDLEYETMYIPYTIEHAYNPDFITPNGIIIEAKGYFDAAAQRKMRAVKRMNPHLDIRFVFMNSNTRIRKSSKLTYAGWCEKYDFPYADGMIPLKWLKEKE